MAAEQNNSERTVVERRDPLLGEVFDRRFRVEAKIAAGGFGAIYRATHIKSGHEFALKVLHPNLTGDPRVVARFRREGAALTRLRDPHTITAYELGEASDGTLYIVMELLRGESLYERYRANGPMPWQRVIAIARAVCSSLAEAHALGIIHRDLKPTNIHLERGPDGEDQVKVLDFGIAKILHGSDIDSTDLTHAGQMIGTLDYMSPEQMVGGSCTATSDIYTLGIVMYEMIAGCKPFDDASSAAAALASVLTMTAPRLVTRAMVTPEVDRIVMRCLEREQAARFQSAQEVAAALDDILLDDDEAVTRLARSSAAEVETPEPGSVFDKPTVRLAPTDALEPSRVVAEPTPIPMRPAAAMAPPAPIVAPPARSSFGSDAQDATLLGPPPLRAPARTHTIGTPQVGTLQMPPKNLREAYPGIHRPPPSPMRPATPFDDRPSSSVSTVRPYEMSRAVRRDAVVARVAWIIAAAVALLAAVVIAGRL